MKRLTVFVFFAALMSCFAHALPAVDGVSCGRVLNVGPNEIDMMVDGSAHQKIKLWLLIGLDEVMMQTERQLALTEMMSPNWATYCAGWTKTATANEVNFVYSQVKVHGF